MSDPPTLPRQRFLFSWRELSGSLGDLGLFIPLVVGMTLVTDFDLGVILIVAGLMNIATGLLFRQPIPVQPMKAIAVVAIAEGLLHNEVVAAGLLMGVVMVVLSVTGLIDHANAFVPKAVVRGIQLGVGLKLAYKGLAELTSLPYWGWESLAVAVSALVLLLVLDRYRQPGALYVFLLGLLLLAFTQPTIWESIQLHGPRFRLHWPATADWTGGLFHGALPQLPLTLLNSVIAVCALSAGYFPRTGVAPRKMAMSVGLMNLVGVSLGGIPMCHGAGGLAAQYRFGARSGGSVIMLGGLKVIAGLLFGASLMGLLHAYPMAVLGPMLVLAGLELARSARDLRAAGDVICAVAMAITILWVDTLAGFLVGVGLVGAFRAIAWYRRRVVDLDHLVESCDRFDSHVAPRPHSAGADYARTDVGSR